MILSTGVSNTGANGSSERRVVGFDVAMWYDVFCDVGMTREESLRNLGGDVLLGNTENHTVYQLLHESLIIRPPSTAKGSAFWSYILPKNRSIDVGPADPYFSTGGSDELILHNVTRLINGTRIRHDLFTALGGFEPPQFVDLIIGSKRKSYRVVSFSVKRLGADY